MIKERDKTIESSRKTLEKVNATFQLTLQNYEVEVQLATTTIKWFKNRNNKHYKQKPKWVWKGYILLWRTIEVSQKGKLSVRKSAERMVGTSGRITDVPS